MRQKGAGRAWGQEGGSREAGRGNGLSEEVGRKGLQGEGREEQSRERLAGSKRGRTGRRAVENGEKWTETERMVRFWGQWNDLWMTPSHFFWVAWWPAGLNVALCVAACQCCGCVLEAVGVCAQPEV